MICHDFRIMWSLRTDSIAEMPDKSSPKSTTRRQSMRMDGGHGQEGGIWQKVLPTRRGSAGPSLCAGQSSIKPMAFPRLQLKICRRCRSSWFWRTSSFCLQPRLCWDVYLLLPSTSLYHPSSEQIQACIMGLHVPADVHFKWTSIVVTRVMLLMCNVSDKCGYTFDYVRSCSLIWIP